MPWAVLLTDDAARDLAEPRDFISANGAPGKAKLVLDRIGKAFISLSQSPERGAWPKELLALGIKEYREIFFKPYRIIYRVTGKRVYVLLIADGRWDMKSLLQRRLLEG